MFELLTINNLCKPFDDIIEDAYTWNFISRWNSSRDEIIPVYGEMSLTVYTFLPRRNFIPGWTHSALKDRWNLISGLKKTWKHFILGWNEHVFFNFGRMYSNMLFKVNVFEHNVNMNIMKHKTSIKIEVRKEKGWAHQVKKYFYYFYYFLCEV